MMSGSKLINQAAKKVRLCASRHRLRGFTQGLKLLSTNARSELARDKEKFQKVLPGIKDSLVIHSRFAEVTDVANWIRKILDYNLAGGKQYRGLITVLAYEMLEKAENISEESMKHARILGWCVEMLNAYILMIDDIMDGSTTRRGVPCWYRMPHVGLGAMNDAMLVHCALCETLKEYFEFSPFYGELVDQFYKNVLYISMGQYLDLKMTHRESKDYSLFTMERYNSIVRHKTSYYTFNLPVSLGLLLANNMDRETHDAVGDICFDLGRLFQIQDDYIDCFGDERLSGKAGTDIQEGKCSWLAVSALQRCSEAQRALFAECYASKQPQHVARIKQLYGELNIPTLYKQEENSLYQDIVKKINSLPSQMPPELFKKLLNVTYERKK